jgi:DNA repair protein RecN (Recombination protein N)
MLQELHISNLAIIEQADIELRPGLNVFTGQTGAGKSLLMTALELLLGLRSGGEDTAMMVRPGASEARVSGLFELNDASLLRELCEIFDQEMPACEPLLITRRVSASGRSSASVNGAPVTADMLRRAGRLLINIHGQGDQQVLLKPSRQVEILDDFAGAADLRGQFAAALRELRDREQQRRHLSESEDKRRDMLDLYRFQLEEINAVDPQPGEYDALRSRCKKLRNIADIKSQAADVLDGLSEGDDSLAERLATLRKALADVCRMDEDAENIAAQLATADDILADAARELWAYQDRLDVDGGELRQAEARLDDLNRILHKYARSPELGTDPVEAVLAYRDRIAGQLAQLESDGQTLEALDRQIAESRQTLTDVGQKLSRRRKKAAAKLQAAVEAELHDLEMADAEFRVDLHTRDAADPAVGTSGLDDVEFLVRTNPGQDLLPLRKIASGGETSRIMLALKTILADADSVPTLIFDEIDSNIGDRLGATIGRKMQALGHAGMQGPQRQILCVTHLSQIAASGDHHLKIAKHVEGEGEDRRTLTTVDVLTGQARVDELADMMAGQNATRATATHARNLLKRQRSDEAQTVSA